MRKSLLFAAVLSLSTQLGWAQATYDTALDATVGENTYTVEGDTYQDVYWKYTPTENCAVKIISTGASIGAYILQDGELFQLKGVNDNYNYIYPLSKNETVYLKGTGRGACGFTMEKKEYEGLGAGLTEDNPLQIKLGAEQLLGNPKAGYYSYKEYNTYATYETDKDGLLVIKASAYFTIKKDGKSISGDYQSTGGYAYKVPVEAGKANLLTFSCSSPFVFTSSFTQPTPGSIDMPFELKVGSNSVPEDFGTYYYTYTPTQAGFLAVSSEETLPGGTVGIYGSKAAVENNYAVATSATGSFNVRAEVSYVSGNTYYIVVNKVESSDAAQAFNFSVEGYKAGEKEENPIVISELPSEQTLDQAQGTWYYALTVPANTNKFVKVKALTKIENATTAVSMYPQGNSYRPTTGNDGLRYNVTNTSEKTYIIKWNAQENTPVKFSVSYEDIKAGDEYANPIKAVAGSNAITGEGDKFFSYTATKTGKLNVSGTPEMTITFPQGSDTWSGEYETFNSGVNYYIEATEGKTYVIKVSGASDGDAIIISELDFAKGESKTNPVEVEGTTYNIDSSISGNGWLKYNVEKDGVLTIASDVVYDGSNLLEAGKSTDTYLSQLITTVQEDGDYKSIYSGSIRVNKGDEILVHMQFKGSVEGKTITFNLRDYNPGESFANPLELVDGQSYQIPTSNYSNPFWCKLSMERSGKWAFANISSSLYGTIYKGKEDAAADMNGKYINTNASYDENWMPTYTLEGTVADGEEGDYYIKVTSTYDVVNFVMSITYNTPSSIKAVAGDAGVRVAGESLIVSDNANVKVYSLGGAKVVEASAAGTISLAKGVYIVNVNGKAQKIAIK